MKSFTLDKICIRKLDGKLFEPSIPNDYNAGQAIADIFSGRYTWYFREVVTFHNTELSKKRSQEIAHDLIEIFDTYYKRNAS